jgi:small subunit ribosomal protein S16
MTTRIRLRRMGANKRPFYRVVVADQRSPRDGRFIEIIGKYHPLSEPSLIEIDEGRALHWLRVGAQPSNQVRNLMTKVGIWEKFVAERPSAAVVTAPRPERPAKERLSKKAQAKAAEAEAAPEVEVTEAEPVAETEAETEVEVTEAEPVAEVAETEAETDADAPVEETASEE